MYLVRHGQTPCSVANVLCGRCDAALTPTGQQTAHALAAAFAKRPWSALYSSPLRRALQTIAPLARASGQSVTPLPDLAEIDFGKWEGLTSATLLQNDDTFKRWVQKPAILTTPSGESGNMVLTRALRAVTAVRARHASGQVMLMTHKTTLRLLLCHITGEPTGHYRQRFEQPLGAVNMVEFLPGGPHLRIVADISYQRGACNPSYAGGAT